MKKIVLAAAAALAIGATPFAAHATPEQDLKDFRAYFKKKNPDIKFEDYVNGAYIYDKDKYEQWVAIEEFPPYETGIDKGKSLWNTPFANGKTYASCFKVPAKGIMKYYPYYDAKLDTVKTLEQEINECRVKNGEKPLDAKKGDMASISAYLAYNSRGETINVKIPNDPGALAWYERGKEHFYTKRGQLNFSCADCHVYNAGNRIRANILSPALGQVSHFPVYRASWGELGTLHRRYGGCNEQVRAKAFKPQSDEYRALEYFHTYMSNGLKYNGPGYRE